MQEETKEQKGTFGTGWNNEPALEVFKQDYANSREHQQEQAVKIRDWLDNLHVSSNPGPRVDSSNPFNDNKKLVPKGKSTVKPKLIRKQAEWRYTSLTEPFLNTPDIFNVDPVTFEDKDGALQNERLLNNQFNTRIDKTKFIDEYVRTCVNEGTVIVRVGWINETETRTVKYPIYEIKPLEENSRKIDNLQEAFAADPVTLPDEVLKAVEMSKETGIPHWVTEVGVEEVEEDVSTKNHPTVEVCEFDNVHIDPSCKGDLDKAQFIIYSFETSRSDLEKDGRYKNLDKIVDNTHSVLADPDHASEYSEGGFSFEDKARAKLVAREYWGHYDIDGNGKTTPIVATWVGDVLIRLEENPYPDKLMPFIVVPYLPVKKSLFGEPDGELLEDNQNILGAVTRGMIDVMARSANGQIGIRKDALDVVNKRRWEKGADYEFNPGVDPRQAVINHTYPELPNSAFQMVMHQNNEAESLSGIKAFNEGISGAGLGDTAAAANGALGAAAQREMGILRRLSNGMRDIARKIIAMNQEFLDDSQVIRVTNSEFVEVKRDDLQGFYDLRLSISTAEADEQKAKELAFMLQTTGQQFGLDMYKIILAEIADLRKMPQLAEQIRNFEPPANPLADAMQEAEVLAAQLANEKTRAEINKLNAEAQAAGAKTLNTQADTDRKNLDYVEQESGVNQEREIEKQKAQSKGNMELEVLKKTLEPNKDETQAPTEL